MLAVIERKPCFLAKILVKYGDFEQNEYLKKARQDENFIQGLMQNILAIEYNEELAISSEMLQKLGLIGRYFRPHVAAKLMKEYGLERCFFIATFCDSLKSRGKAKGNNSDGMVLFTLETWRKVLNFVIESKYGWFFKKCQNFTTN